MLKQQASKVPSSMAGVLGENLPGLYAAIIESSDDAIISKDLDGIITTWNPAATRIFGYLPGEIIGKHVTTLFPEELKHQEVEILRKIRSGEKIDHLETIRVRKNGERFPVSLTTSPIRDNSGKVIGASKILRDVSDRAASQEARLRLSAIVESSDDAIVSKDLNGIVRSWNRGATRIFGYEPDEIVGKSILTIIPPELHNQEPYILGKIGAGERIEHFETERITKDGRRIFVSLTISPMKDENGKVIGASKIARDISQRRQMELALMQSEKLAATGKMAATIAHEINNPMEAVINLIFLARNHSSVGEEVRDYLLTAEKEIERLSMIARQTLAFYRETSTPTAVVMHDVVSDVLAVYQSRFRGREIKVKTAFGPVQSLLARRGELVQIISNLISNAIDAMSEGGRLTIKVEESETSDGEGIELVISDQGTGIQQENLQKLFEPFFTTKRNVGTGLGLWIVKQFVQNHDGQISVTSSTAPESHGTTFKIFLPYENSFSETDGNPISEIPMPRAVGDQRC